MMRKVLPALMAASLVWGLACGPAPQAPARPRTFQHPGVLVNRAQLDLVKAHVRAGAEPWKSAFENARGSRWAALDWTPKPRAVVECGPYSRPDVGCQEEKNDAAAAYLHALLWVLTEDESHARKSIEILNAWSAVVRDHTNHNAPLQAAWTASVFPRAAEIVRHTYDGWAAADVERFAAMLKDVYLAEFAEGSANTNGNWELSMIEAIVAIAVFTDDRPLFDRGLEMWRRRVPAYFYVTSDGESPVPAPADDTPEKVVKRWYGQARMVEGLCQETCRDFGHTQYGIAAAVNTAETALHQGVDLYETEARRLTAALELHARFLLGETAPEWLCNGKLDLRMLPTWEIAYNHFAIRARRPLPLTAQLLRERVRLDADGSDTSAPRGSPHHILWETLTHAGVGRAGLR